MEPTEEHKKNQLTFSQQRVMDFILMFWRENKFSPSIMEITQAMGFASPTAAEDHVTRLQRKGFISRKAGVALSIVPTKISDHLERLSNVAES